MVFHVKGDIWGWYHSLYLNRHLVWQLGSYVDMLLMGFSLWPERARQLEILVDWHPRDWKTLLMCFSRHIYNWFLELWSRNSCGSYRHLQTCCKFVHAVVVIRLVFGNYISSNLWIVFQITAAKRTKHHTLELSFHTAWFLYSLLW